MKKILLTLILALIVISGSKAAFIFPTADSVPISPYTEINQTEASFWVSPPVLLYLTQNNSSIVIVYWDSVAQQFLLLTPSEIDVEGGIVKTTITGNLGGTGVVVTDFFQNAFPVVTHWNQSLNGGKGGPQTGGTDPIGTLDWNSVTDLVGLSTPLFNDSPGASLKWNLDEFALFSGDPNVPNATTPFYERYIGEDYTTSQPTELAAYWLSNFAIEYTGYPAIFHNYPNYTPLINAPVFQVIHAVKIEVAPGYGSLATIVLPPFWTPNPTTPYPVLFSSMYDVHETLYQLFGPIFFYTMGKTFNDGLGQSIGVIWNGGGAQGTLGMHRSAYENAALLFQTLENNFGADTQSIVASGLSRGAGTVIATAANPYHDSYRVKYLFSYNPPLKLGDICYDMVPSSYPSYALFHELVTGYNYAWQSDWRHPDYQMGSEPLMSYYLTGALDKETANSLSPFGDAMLQSLQDKETWMLISHGTHDSFYGSHLTFEFDQKARSYGIPLRREVGYRAGHNLLNEGLILTEHLEKALTAVLTDTPISLGEGTFHYKRADNTGINYEEFVPEKQPFYFEGPPVGFFDKRHVYHFMGAPGTEYVLQIIKIDQAVYDASNQVVETPEYYVIDQMVLPSTGESWAHETHEIYFPPTIPTGHYLYRIYYRLEGSVQWNLVPETNTAQIGKLPLLEILSNEPDITGVDFRESYQQTDRGTGLSQE